MSQTILPCFIDGLLPPGDYPLTIEALRSSHLVTGSCSALPNWDEAWRMHLVDNLEIMVKQLWHINLDRIFVDGSFVQEKEHPGDIDAYFECSRRDFASGSIQRQLNDQDPYKSWVWSGASRHPTPLKPTPQLPMWFQYHVELWPHYPGLLSGIPDKNGRILEFPPAFRRDKETNRRKGVIQLVRTPV